MKPYSDYSAEELAMENLFIRWVRFPDDPSICTFWENWMTKYPSKKDTIEKARELVLVASDWKPDVLSNQEINSLWGRIRSSLEIIGEAEPISPSVTLLGNSKLIGGIILLIMSVTFLFIVLYFFFGNF
ncbi:hypothetical protein [Dyadobacter sp. NIV53]|uniref:hypothetical protein n=1 Tax=Dyadobacter sp. NIV53 TaxID=2861765 RepID=UPI001E3BE5EB|nr:hypothetical protein [Dyadobacter sp. NIV53]